MAKSEDTEHEDKSGFKTQLNKDESLLLNDAEKISQENDDLIDGEPSNKLVDLINAINVTLFGKEIDQKSKLNSTTARGIKRAIAFNNYMEQEYGYKYKSLDALINATLRINKSINAHAFDKSVEAIKGLSTNIELNELRGVSFNDRMTGRR